MERRPFIAVYLEASRPFGVIYTGVTSNLMRRGYEHREGVIDGFSKRYGCGLLVWYERHVLMAGAIRREKALKRWNRAWKMQLIERENPAWADLYPTLSGSAPDPRVKPEDDGGVAAFLRGLDQNGTDASRLRINPAPIDHPALRPLSPRHAAEPSRPRPRRPLLAF